MFRHDALLLVGHGSTSMADAARPLLAHAEIIRQTGTFKEVGVGMLLGQPVAAAAFAALTSPLVFVVPFFLDDGYFTRIAIPELLLPLASGTRVIRFCQPVGSHDDIAALLDARLTAHCDTFDVDRKSLSVLLVGHGSAQNPGRARTMQRHATTLDAGGRFGRVRIAYLEEPPFVADALAGARGHLVAVIGYFANEGAHSTVDLPTLILAERAFRGANWPPVHDLGSIGSDPAMPRLIMDQAAAAR